MSPGEGVPWGPRSVDKTSNQGALGGPWRSHNDRRLRWWLDASYPDRIAGRIDPETPMDRKAKREGSSPLKGKSVARLDDPSLSETDRKLLAIFFERLPDRLPGHYYRASLTNLLDPSLAGGYVQLEQLELRVARRPKVLAEAHQRYEKARRSQDQRNLTEAEALLQRVTDAGIVVEEAARVTRAVYEWVLSELDREGFRLDVEPAERVKLREQKRDESRMEAARAKFIIERKKRSNDAAAVKATAAETGYSASQIRRMTVDLRDPAQK